MRGDTTFDNLTPTSPWRYDDITSETSIDNTECVRCDLNTSPRDLTVEASLAQTLFNSHAALYCSCFVQSLDWRLSLHPYRRTAVLVEATPDCHSVACWQSNSTDCVAALVVVWLVLACSIEFFVAALSIMLLSASSRFILNHVGCFVRRRSRYFPKCWFFSSRQVFGLAPLY